MRIVLIFCITFICSSTIVDAQQFGAISAQIKLRQIDTDTVRVIFPEGLDSAARRVVAIVHQLQRRHNSSIGPKLQKINIVLQHQTTFSNAYVGLGPYRSEFYLTPPQDAAQLGGVNWLDNLAIHEFRHVQQYSNFNTGIAKFINVLFGQEGRAVANAMAIPDWFFEGDAVFNETYVSQQGRGKLPYNFNGYKSLNNSKKHYSFLKLRNGSLKDFVPDHYDLGYLLVAYGREKYGAEIWKKVTADAAAFRPLIYPFQGAVKKYTGVPYKTFVGDAFKFYQQQWQSESGNALQFITKQQKTVTNYKYPYAENNSVIVLKNSYNQIPAFYRITATGSETKIAVRDIGYEDYFSFKNGQIIYAAWQPDSRWGYKEYSNIKVLDVATKLEQEITTKTRYFSPDISADGQKIVAVDIQPNQTAQLHILNTEGKVTDRINNDEHLFYSYPKFSETADSIIVVARKDNGSMGLLLIDLFTKKQEWLIAPANRIIAYPVYQKGTIIFTSSGKTGDEIHRYDIAKQKHSVIATQPTGLYQACFINDSLVAAVFTADGMRLAKVTDSAAIESNYTLAPLYVKTAYQEADFNFLNDINLQHQTNPVKKYKRSTNLLNFHSWRPYYEQPDFSFTIYGQNVLNTLQSELAYNFNENEQSHKISYDAIYGGTYIQPIAGVSQTFDRNALYRNDTSFFWNEFSARIGAQLPLNLSGGKQYRFLNLSASYHVEDVKWTGIAAKLLQPLQFNYIQTRLSYSAQIQKAPQHIYPRFGQSLLIQYRAMVNQYKSNQFLISGAVYIPGFSRNHNLLLTAASQSRDTMNNYYFSNSFPFSRGYRAIDFPRMNKLGVNYHFPLFYPDRGVGSIVYLLRVRANVFYDYTQTRSVRTRNTFIFSTAGAEIYFDTKWWNQQEVSFGIRFSRLLDSEYRGITQPNQWEFIMPVNLF